MKILLNSSDRMEDIKRHIDEKFDLLHSDLKLLTTKVDSHREEYLREVTEIKTKVSIFKTWMSGVAAFIGAAVSALISWVNH